MVNIESPQSRRPRSSMTPAEIEQTRRSCSICKKLFCCSQCRERHEKTKHSKQQLDCPFCTSHKLPSQIFEDKPLLVHIVIAHLPLYCYLCGEVYKQSKDIETFGTCKWWKSRHRHSLGSAQKAVLGTPPLIAEGKESSLNNDYNGNFGSLTSPPALYRTTSTPMVVGEKNSFDCKTPNVPNFTLKTPKTSSASLKIEQTHSGFQESAESNYLSFPSSANQENTPFRGLSSSRGNKDDLPRSNSKKLDVMKEQDRTNPGEQCASNSDVVDMELTGVEGEVVPQGLDTCVQVEKRSDSLKKVRFSDQYENSPDPSATSAVNMTENEEYFEACDTLSEAKENLENSQIKIYAENVQNTNKEIRSPDKQNGNVNQQSSGSSRVVMMVVVENNSNLSTSDLIDSGLKKLGHISSGTSLPTSDSGTPAYSSSVTTVNNYYSLSSQASYSTSNQMISSLRRDSNSSSNSSDSGSSVGIFSAVANAVRTVMRNFSGAGTTRNIDREQVPPREDIVPRPTTSEAFHPLSSLASSLLRRPGKRSRDAIESVPSSQRQMDVAVPQIEMRSPLAKRPRGWYRIKGREPIARMRNTRITSPRGVSSETQVFHQGSLSVGDTVLPLPSRAHQSTQTE
ncbi:uncharacterized protein LOC143373033 isoform X1 [Andrena cerasifolii]|uniref:uncharacterized protein LOC143373033 isoform X1 n=1 Tax=Andrena cerasifolii TaxID=2819439 RepID=UPI004037A382